MESKTNYPELANHLRRIIPAFILSNIFQFLQIWLGVEFSNFSKELRRASGNTEDEALSKIAKYFLAAGVLTIITFTFWLIPFILPYIMTYIGGHTIYIPYFGYELDYIVLLQYASIGLPAIIGLIQTGLLFKAWRQIRVFFNNKDQQRHYRSGGVVGAGRVIWAMELSGVGYALLVAGFILFAIEVTLSLYSTIESTLIGIGFLMSLAGIINQCIGMGQTARVFQNLARPIVPTQSSPQVQPQDQYPRYQPSAPPVVYTPEPIPPQIQDPRPRPQEPPRQRFCTGCGAELPETPGLRFCPTCGSKI